MRFRVPSLHAINAGASASGFSCISTFSGVGGSSLGYRLAGIKPVLALEFVREAADAYLANFPDTPVLVKNVRETSGAELLALAGINKGELDILDGSPPCFVAGTLILTRRGLVPIEDVAVGDEVLTHNLRWRPVVERHERDAETVEVSGQGVVPITTTAEHPFYVRRQIKIEAGRYERSTKWRPALAEPHWRPASDIGSNGLDFYRPGSIRYYWAAPAKVAGLPIPPVDPENARSHFIALDESFFYLVGRWVGDGWLRTGKTHCGRMSRGEVLICCAKDERHRLQAAVAAVFGERHSGAEQRTTWRFTICCKPLAQWLEGHFGRGAEGKTIPAWLLGADERLRRAFLDGYLDADGSVVPNGRKCRTISKRLAIGVRLLAASLGMPVTMSGVTPKPTTVIEGRIVNQRPAYVAAIYEGGTGKTNTELEHGMLWSKVRKVEPTGRVERVYNIGVDEDESYVADGTVVHNCKSFTLAALREKAWGQEKWYSEGHRQRTDDLFFEYVRLIDEIRPKVFVAENVSGLVAGKALGYFAEFFEAMQAIGYVVEARLLDASLLGVPQRRKRLIFQGVRRDLAEAHGVRPSYPAPVLRPGREVTLAEAFAGLPSPSPDDDPKTCHWLKPGSKTRRAWDLTDMRVGSGMLKYTYEKHFGKSARYSWFKLPPDRPSVTITATVPCILHWAEPRSYTIPEVKRLQSFPDDFVVPGTYEQAYERIGRAVPPLLMKAVAERVRDDILIPLREAGA